MNQRRKYMEQLASLIEMEKHASRFLKYIQREINKIG